MARDSPSVTTSWARPRLTACSFHTPLFISITSTCALDLGLARLARLRLSHTPSFEPGTQAEEWGATIFAGALISHGDDQCRQTDGGVACLVRRMPPNHVQWLRSPLSIDCDVNDVRANGSEPLTHYVVVALRSATQTDLQHPLPRLRSADEPPRPSGQVEAPSPLRKPRDEAPTPVKALTQMRLEVEPLHPQMMHAFTYGAHSRPPQQRLK